MFHLVLEKIDWVTHSSNLVDNLEERLVISDVEGNVKRRAGGSDKPQGLEFCTFFNLIFLFQSCKLSEL